MLCPPKLCLRAEVGAMNSEPVLRSERLFSGRNVDVKPGPVIQLTAGRDYSIVVLNNFFNDRQTNTCPRIFIISMQALEYFKNSLIKLRLEANSIVSERNMAIQGVRH